MDDMQPGQVISPQASAPSLTPAPGSPVPERPAEQPELTPTPSPAPEPSTLAPSQATAPYASPAVPEVSTVPAELSAEVQPSAWQTSEAPEFSEVGQPSSDTLSWTASEFIAHEKNAAWYAMLAAVGVIIIGLIYFVTKDKISTGIVALVIVMFGLYAARKPRTLEYVLDGEGLRIGAKPYLFQEFKTFSVTDEGDVTSIMFMPLKRFSPPLSIYVSPDIEDGVVDFLADYLPLEQHPADMLESLLRRIHF